MKAALALLLLLTASAQAQSPRHLIYLHGRIIQEQQSARPKHAEHGYYELDAIKDTLRKRGFVVHAEIRPKTTTVSSGADAVVEQVRGLIQSGVPAKHITVAGASMGAAIAMRVAVRLREPDVRFVFLSPCISTNFPAVMKEEGAPPVGHLLVIREESDIPTKDCPPWTGTPQARELVIDTGLRHGFLYRPLPEWVEPVVQWANGDE
ncbi:MAG: hypothetical protein ACLGH0_13585 [Thermoanaerobaculia bacterium]